LYLIPQQDLPRPIVLFADGHSSHYNEAVHDLCNENGITFYILKAHSSHIIQPLDLVFYGQLKREWSAAKSDFKVSYYLT